VKYLGVTLDSRLSFQSHILSIAQRVRKLTFVFKQLRHIVDEKLMRNIYLALCHSIVSYCITIWGGAAKSHMIVLERAQRLILKVGHGKPRLYPTADLYTDYNVLTVRQTYLFAVIMRQHSLVPFNKDHPLANTRRYYKICNLTSGRSKVFRRSFSYQGCRQYNLANKNLNIYPRTSTICRNILKSWLQTKNYDELEEMIAK
jgi:hypothetical protein